MASLEEQLFNAVILGDSTRVSCLLSQGANVNVVCATGRTALGTAAESGDIAMLKVLLDGSGANTSLIDNDQDIQHFQKKYKGKKIRKKGASLKPYQNVSGEEDSDSDMSHNSIAFDLCHSKSADEAIGGQGKDRCEKNNLGYFIMVHEDGEDENLNLGSPSMDPSGLLNDLCTPDGMERLEWDVEVEGCDRNAETDEDSWASLYRWYADILDRTGSLLQPSTQFDVNHLDVYGRSAAHYAAEHGHLDALRLLRAAGCQLDITDSDNLTPLHLAAIRDHEPVVRMLLASGVQVNRKTSDKTSALHMAASRGHTGAARALLENGASVDALDASDRTPLLLAVSRGHEELACVLLQHGAKVNIEEIHGYTPLCEAVWQKAVSLVQLLLDAGAKVTQSHFLLHDAVMHRHLEMVRLLLRAGCIVNLRDDNGDTPLIVAARTGHVPLAKLLLENGAFVNYPNSLTGSLPLHEAVQYVRHTQSKSVQSQSFESMFKLFLSYGALLDVQTCYGGDTPLFRAVVLENDHTAAFLIRHGANVNLSSPLGDANNLSLTMMRGNFPLVRMLVYAGFNLRKFRSYWQPSTLDPVEVWLEHMKRNPMRLCDLCRIVIRQALGTNLYAKVEILFLPVTLKSFLLMEDMSL